MSATKSMGLSKGAQIGRGRSSGSQTSGGSGAFNQSRREMASTARSSESDGALRAVFAVAICLSNMSALQVLLYGKSLA